MRALEENEIQKCEAIIKRMKETAYRQKTLSTDIKTGIAELEEAMEVIKSLRSSWSNTEAQLKDIEAKQLGDEEQREKEARKKRPLQSPSEEQEQKKRREENHSTPWIVVASKRSKRPSEQILAALIKQKNCQINIQDT